ncbi:MAG: hypothetical protein OET42_11745, partial [Deltaproteobacteria bacterium]|nr:hypothetical protein [Deltaproteobacteria bacterium]
LHQRHREHRDNFIFARSGDGDRAKEHNPPCRLLATNIVYQAVGICQPEVPPKAVALFSGRRLPAREKYLSSVSSVSPWLMIRLFIQHPNWVYQWRQVE